MRAVKFLSHLLSVGDNVLLLQKVARGHTWRAFDARWTWALLQVVAALVRVGDGGRVSWLGCRCRLVLKTSPRFEPESVFSSEDQKSNLSSK